ncbi:hypothetical protein Tco_0001702 [Tanacetum coccineum]
MISDMKKELLAHQETISIMSQEKEAQIKFYKTREDKELDKVIALENKIKVLDDIVYKTRQSVQTMNMLNRNCKISFEKPEILKKAQRVNPRLYDIGCYNDNLALMLAPDSNETIRLANESRSKLSDLIRPFDYDQLNNLYDLFVPQREKSPEQQYFSKASKMSHTSSMNEISQESFHKQQTLLEKQMDESLPWDEKCKSSKEIFKIKKSVDMIFDGVERFKQTIAKRTYFGREYYYADHMNAILGVYTDLDELEVKLVEQVKLSALIKYGSIKVNNMLRKVKKIENKLVEKRKSKEAKDAEGQDQEVPFETDQGDTFATPEKSKGSGEAQEEQISPSTLEAAQILSNVASEGFKGSQAPLAQVNTARVNTAELNPDSTPSAQVNTGEVNTAEVNTGETERVQRRKGKEPMTEEDLQAEVQVSKKSKELQELADLEEALKIAA